MQKSIDSDIKLGKRYSEEIEKVLKLSEDKNMIERVQRIGQEIALIANQTQAQILWGDVKLHPFHYIFKVVKEEDVNAFSLPGGFIYVHEGLINFVESDHELAAVLGHEIAHAAFRHIAHIQKKEAQMILPMIPLILAGILTGESALFGLGQATQYAGTAFISNWNQQAEDAADFGSIQFLLKSKYNPIGMLTFEERLSRRNVDMHWGIYQTHPTSKERVKKILSILQHYKIPIKRSVTTFTLRVKAIENEDKSITLNFLGQKLYNFTGTSAQLRSNQALKRLNAFFDEVPKMFDVQVGKNFTILGKNQPLIQITEKDACGAKVSQTSLAELTLNAIKAAVFNLTYHVWN